ncbi:SDR family oxidoreductase [Luteibacter sp. dw_328]|uniref:SDR family oxidoreductase n=1 Tax=Luteibacter sp. dw_328 TaxID=2719796 RepID=UPI001BD68673|nr:SDR family oxidoreductase [Luteibacter sp. dw_328]
MQKILIAGATSAIAEATARLYAASGSRLHLLGRNVARLKDIADDLRVRGAADVTTGVLDMNDVDAHASAIEQAITALGEIDIVLVAHGTLPDQPACEASVQVTLREFATNGTSTIAFVTAVVPHLLSRRAGTIAVISSVAGDRGRQSNYVYGAAKAAVTTFLSGLRQRLGRDGVNVLTIKPGFVDTPMTAAFKKGALWATPDAIAAGIERAIDRRAGEAYLPRFWWAIMFVIRHIPEFIFRRLKL